MLPLVRSIVVPSLGECVKENQLSKKTRAETAKGGEDRGLRMGLGVEVLLRERKEADVDGVVGETQVI